MPLVVGVGLRARGFYLWRARLNSSKHAHVGGNCQAKPVKLMHCSKGTHVAAIACARAAVLRPLVPQ
jgi:hypothetical protein